MMAPELQGLKQASAALVRAAGGYEAAASFCRLGKSQLNNACNINDDGCFMPVDVIVALESVTHDAPGAPIATRYQAQRAGYGLFKLPVADAGPVDWHQLLADQIKEGGDVMQAIAVHAASGLDRRKIIDSNLVVEIDQAIAVLVNMRAAAAAIVAGE